ncbi:MAG: DUF2892 domain-containing protein [Campylobacterota bacterium]|nr:DUF2892 domain-containing protein [Campylobacterota bacterium]
MNIFDKIKKFCGTFRIILGVVVLALGFYFTAEEQFYNIWFGLGVIPLIAGLTNFCPLCLITKKCTI